MIHCTFNYNAVHNKILHFNIKVISFVIKKIGCLILNALNYSTLTMKSNFNYILQCTQTRDDQHQNYSTNSTHIPDDSNDNMFNEHSYSHHVNIC